MAMGSEAAKPSGLDGRAYPKLSPGLAAPLGTRSRPLVLYVPAERATHASQYFDLHQDGEVPGIREHVSPRHIY